MRFHALARVPAGRHLLSGMRTPGTAPGQNRGTGSKKPPPRQRRRLRDPSSYAAPIALAVETTSTGTPGLIVVERVIERR
ncbi:MAG: hypothetical protein AMXMBFR61_26790 [Fimbriimonadales bacterium]